MNWPLMKREEDFGYLIDFLKSKPRLTAGTQVKAFEKEWSEWLGVKYSVFVNSGSSANLITLATLKAETGSEIIVPTLTWVSDIAAVIQNGFKPVFVDIDPYSFGMDTGDVINKITHKTAAVFITHVLGFNALTTRLMTELNRLGIPLIEDCCESHGATFNGEKVGTHGLMSNFSFYYAHHLSTIEGGMVCTNDEKMYQVLRMHRSHGLVRETTSDRIKHNYWRKYPDLDPQFIFATPSYNVRSTEINAVMGRKGLKNLFYEMVERNNNLEIFLTNLDPSKYRTDLKVEGCSNYALPLVLNKSFKRRDDVKRLLKDMDIEYRRGLSGGGNQLRQPYLSHVFRNENLTDYPEVEHIHFYSFYIGNYPGLEEHKIKELCKRLNEIT